MEKTVDRPEVVTNEMLSYLDTLRESGVTNMFGATPWVANAFDIPKEDARKVLSYWMETFGKEKR